MTKYLRNSTHTGFTDNGTAISAQKYDETISELYDESAIRVDSMQGLLFASNPSDLADGACYLVQNFYSNSTGGGDPFFWDANGDKADHDGIKTVDPTHSTTPGQPGWWTSENTGTTGVFRRREKGYLTAYDAGAKLDGSTDDSSAIQNAHDVIFSNGGGVLDVPYSDSGISLGSTIDIKDKVEIKFNQNDVKPASASTDLFNIYPGGQINNPNIVTTGVTYSGNAITLDATLFGNYTVDDKTRIKATGQGTDGEGTFLFYHQNGANEFISWVESDIQISGFNKGIDLYSEDASGWINGNIFRGTIRGCTTQIHMRGASDPRIDGNQIYMQLQPTAASDYGWRVDIGQSNVFIGKIWDTVEYTNFAVTYGSGTSINSYISIGEVPLKGKLNDDGGTGNDVVGIRGGQWKYWDSISGNYHTIKTEGDTFQYLIDDSRIFNIDGSGVYLSSGEFRTFINQTTTTAGRPGSPGIGQQVFDTDLGQPVWYDGTNWVDAQGTTV